MTIQQEFKMCDDGIIRQITKQDVTKIFKENTDSLNLGEGNTSAIQAFKKDEPIHLARIPMELLYQYLNKYGKKMVDYKHDLDFRDRIIQEIIRDNRCVLVQDRYTS